MAVVIPKLAVVILIRKIAGPTHHKATVVLFALVVLNILASIVDIVILYVQCSPAYSAWEPEVPHACWDPNILTNYSYFVGGKEQVPKAFRS